MCEICNYKHSQIYMFLEESLGQVGRGWLPGRRVEKKTPGPGGERRSAQNGRGLDDKPSEGVALEGEVLRRAWPCCWVGMP